MSEAVSRRQFLARGLATTASTLAPALLFTQDQATTGTNSAYNRLVVALNDFITAHYNQDLLSQNKEKLKRKIAKQYHEELDKKWEGLKQRVAAEPIEQKQKHLETCLAENGLSTSLVGALERGLAGSLAQRESTKELTDFFGKFGLSFHGLVTNSIRGYELIRITPPEPRTIELFGQKHTVAIKKILEELILHRTRHNAKQLPGLPIVSSGYNPASQTIDYRVHDSRAFAERHYETYAKNNQRIAEELKDPAFLNQFLESGNDFQTPGLSLNPSKRVSQEFLSRVSAQLEYLAQKELQTRKTREECIEQLAKEIDEDILFHEGMHAVDYPGVGDWSFVSKHLATLKEKKRWDDEDVEGLRKDLLGEGFIHSEARGYLSSMCHGHSIRAFSQVVRMSDAPSHAQDVYYIVGRRIINGIQRYLSAQHKAWPQFGIDKNTGGHEILQKLPTLIAEKKLTEDDIKKISRDTFQMMYEGRTLKEHVLHIIGN